MEERKIRITTYLGKTTFFTKADLYQLTRCNEIEISKASNNIQHVDTYGYTLGRLIRWLTGNYDLKITINRYCMILHKIPDDHRIQIEKKVVDAIRTLEKSKITAGTDNVAIVYDQAMSQAKQHLYYFNLKISKLWYSDLAFSLEGKDLPDDHDLANTDFVYKILNIPGVINVGISHDYVMVQIADLFRWNEVEPKIKKLFNKAFKKHFVYKDISKI